MKQKCENCSSLDYLIPFKLTGEITKLVCSTCFNMFTKAKNEAKLMEESCKKKESLRKAFGKIGES